jgi:hypothetical protein
MAKFLASIYNSDITQVIVYEGTIYKHLPSEAWFILGTV